MPDIEGEAVNPKTKSGLRGIRDDFRISVQGRETANF
jgi:hypothetical protein